MSNQVVSDRFAFRPAPTQPTSADEDPRPEEGHTIFFRALAKTFAVLTAISAGITYLARTLSSGG